MTSKDAGIFACDDIFFFFLSPLEAADFLLKSFPLSISNVSQMALSNTQLQCVTHPSAEGVRCYSSLNESQSSSKLTSTNAFINFIQTVVPCDFQGVRTTRSQEENQEPT